MRVLITGARGFVGQHLIHYLQNSLPDVEIHGTVLEEPPASIAPTMFYYQLDLKNAQALDEVMVQVQPDHIYHLAAQAFVPRSFEAPWETLENNIRAQLNVIQACMKQHIQPRMLIVSSAEIYGAVEPHELPLDEEAVIRPSSPYSVSKVAQDMLGLQYYLSDGLPIMRARPFNHFGPGQNERFVAPAFAMQIARIEAGEQEPIMHVGDLTAKRDFTDVRDIVRAYRLIVEKGQPGEAYNVASGRASSIRVLLDILLGFTQASIQVEVDEARLRPTKIPILQGDATRLREATGWEPMIPMEQTLQDVLDDARQRLRKQGAIAL